MQYKNSKSRQSCTVHGRPRWTHICISYSLAYLKYLKYDPVGFPPVMGSSPNPSFQDIGLRTDNAAVRIQIGRTHCFVAFMLLVPNTDNRGASSPINMYRKCFRICKIYQYICVSELGKIFLLRISVSACQKWICGAQLSYVNSSDTQMY
jgi:hypothetical protein